MGLQLRPSLAASSREPLERPHRREPLHGHEPRVSLPRERHEQAPPELRVPRLHVQPRQRELLHRYEPPRVLLPRVLLREQPPLAAPPREPHERHCRREPLHLHEPRVSLPRERHEQAPPELRVPRLHVQPRRREPLHRHPRELLQLRPPLAASSREPLERPRRREPLHLYEPWGVLLPRVLLREQPPLAAPP